MDMLFAIFQRILVRKTAMNKNHSMAIKNNEYWNTFFFKPIFAAIVKVRLLAQMCLGRLVFFEQKSIRTQLESIGPKMKF